MVAKIALIVMLIFFLFFMWDTWRKEKMCRKMQEEYMDMINNKYVRISKRRKFKVFIDDEIPKLE